jgi:hypothetical protein
VGDAEPLGDVSQGQLLALVQFLQHRVGQPVLAPPAVRVWPNAVGRKPPRDPLPAHPQSRGDLADRQAFLHIELLQQHPRQRVARQPDPAGHTAWTNRDAERAQLGAHPRSWDAQRRRDLAGRQPLAHVQLPECRSQG